MKTGRKIVELLPVFLIAPLSQELVARQEALWDANFEPPLVSFDRWLPR